MSQIQSRLAILLLGTAFAILPSAPAFAKKGKARVNVKTPKAAAPIAKKKTKNYDFLADDIEASRVRPDGTAIFGLTGVTHKSLISLRADFIGEILKSAEQL